MSFFKHFHSLHDKFITVKRLEYLNLGSRPWFLCCLFFYCFCFCFSWVLKHSTKPMWNRITFLHKSTERPLTKFSDSLLNSALPTINATKLEKILQLCNKILKSKQNKLKTKIQKTLLQQERSLSKTNNCW